MHEIPSNVAFAFGIYFIMAAGGWALPRLHYEPLAAGVTAMVLTFCHETLPKPIPEFQSRNAIAAIVIFFIFVVLYFAMGVLGDSIAAARGGE